MNVFLLFIFFMLVLTCGLIIGFVIGFDVGQKTR